MERSKPVAHPEVVVGIPQAVVVVRPQFKRFHAHRVGYDGPLTLAEAVEQGRVPLAWAERLVDSWKRARQRQFPELPAPVIVRRETEAL
jgi:hypothetical protein